ncbi:hemicentin-1-like isoform X2 [Mya arenaria]|uniref:hemicentin-1-like isoform X2 n=1 Tax=Mya arenaria TaxID=6604 RepID=UPI0022E0090E|nr:hemicentin-1-like isoform X2 [Mya arenaria]
MKVQFLVCDNTVMSGLNFRIAIVMIVVCRIYTGVNESVIVSPSEVTVPEGSSLTLTCTYTGNDQLYGITWTNNGNDSGRKYDITIELSKPCTLFGKPGLNETLFTYTCFTLTVLNVTRNNQRDNFTCAAVAGAGTRRSDNSVIVYVSVPMSTIVLASPTEAIVTLAAGASKTFTCRTSGGLPKPTVEWYKTSSNNCARNSLRITTNISISPSENNGLIQVESSLDFTVSSTDDYMRICCAASNTGSQWKLSGTKLLNIRYHPGLPTLHLDSTLGPVIDGPLNIVVQQPFTLACNASSKPAANYTWTGGVNVAQGQLLHDTLISKINTIRTCIAKNTINYTAETATTGSSSATVTIHINYPPEDVSIRHESESGINIQSEFRVIKGDAVKLYCSVQSQPPSSYTWSGEGIHSLGSNLVYSNTLQSKTGTLSCFAGNSMMHGNQAVNGSASKNISLNVLYPPKLQTLPRINAIEGNTILIQCRHTAGNPMKTMSTITRTVDDVSWIGDSHTIQIINRTDAGIYRCTVENSMDPTGAAIRTGIDAADFEISVWFNTSISRFGVSTFPNQNIVTISESERLIIECEVLSNPHSTIRLKQNHMAAIILEKEHVHELEFVIQNTSCFDSAVYTCSAFNNYTDITRTPSKELQLFVRCSLTQTFEPS